MTAAKADRREQQRQHAANAKEHTGRAQRPARHLQSRAHGHDRRRRHRRLDASQTLGDGAHQGRRVASGSGDDRHGLRELCRSQRQIQDRRGALAEAALQRGADDTDDDPRLPVGAEAHDVAETARAVEPLLGERLVDDDAVAFRGRQIAPAQDGDVHREKESRRDGVGCDARAPARFAARVSGGHLGLPREADVERDAVGDADGGDARE
jgi:hypothetical protein